MLRELKFTQRIKSFKKFELAYIHTLQSLKTFYIITKNTGISVNFTS